MSRKRRNTSSPEPDNSPQPKRSRTSLEGNSYEFPSRRDYEQARVDPVYGLQGAFPGLGDNDEFFYGPANDGIDYLRMVRSEAKGVPLILHAQTSHPEIGKDQDEENEWDSVEGGYYEDGAFVAAPTLDAEPLSKMPDAQELYYASLLSRYGQLQERLNAIPPLSAIELLTSSQPISFPPGSAVARKKWREILRTKRPHPTQIACMDAESVLEMICLLADSMTAILREGTENTLRLFGAWTWASLGKAKHITELGSEEVSELRRLGKKAADLVEGSQSTAGDKERDNDGQDLGSELDPAMSVSEELPTASTESVSTPGKLDEDKELETVKLKLAARLEHQEEKRQDGSGASVKHASCGESRVAAMTLDMILTIIGEAYGQRDLLKFRHVWQKRRHPEPSRGS